MGARRLALLGLLIGLVVAFFWLDLGQYFDLAALKAHQAALQAGVAAQPWRAAGLYLLVYVAVAALSLPGATLLTLVGGALFGLLAGTLLVSLASTLGATLAMLLGRFLLRDWLRGRFASRLDAIDRGMDREGAFYLFALRLVPAFPFFLVNLAMGLTRLPVRTFWWVSQLGMLPGTLVYVNAGRELGRLESLAGILSPGLLGAFVLLGIFPLLARRLLAGFEARRVYAGWPRPRRFERNLVVIGAGAGGLVSAYLAAALQARVTLIEKARMGGDCLNSGCVPSKALLRSARLARELRRAEELGFREVSGEADFAAVMERVQRVVARIAPHDSVERYTALGVEVIEGEARITSPWTVEADGRSLTTRAIVIAAGARPLLPAIPGLAEMQPYTSDSIWALRERPRRLLVLGGGPIGCELGQAFQRLGCRVILVEQGERLLGREDPEVSAAVAASLRAEGVELRLGQRAERFEAVDGQRRMVARELASGREVGIDFDRVLVALGRVANVEGYGVEELGLALRPEGTLETDEFLATRFPNVFAVGDVAGPYQFTHFAAHQAWYAAVNALFGDLRRFRADYRVIPRVTFTDPEVARVGLSEAEARERGVAFELTRYELAELDRAIVEEAAEGFVKVLTAPGSDRILGATIVGEQAGELLAEFALAMRHDLGLNKILATVHSYPTLAEANKYAAGAWRQAHAPGFMLRLLAGFQRWRRGTGR
ncbi:FAD-dependent oxidoreductase [Pseudomonas stutzeri]|nr:FAD-dependent oxidoreductase [Stutzerimonas stutzeri]